MSNNRTRRLIDRFTRVQVSIEPREVAARNVQADSVANLEHISCRPEIDVVLVNFAGYHFSSSTRAITVTRPHNAIG